MIGLVACCRVAPESEWTDSETENHWSTLKLYTMMYFLQELKLRSINKLFLNQVLFFCTNNDKSAKWSLQMDIYRFAHFTMFLSQLASLLQFRFKSKLIFWSLLQLELQPASPPDLRWTVPLYYTLPAACKNHMTLHSPCWEIQWRWQCHTCHS